MFSRLTWGPGFRNCRRTRFGVIVAGSPPADLTSVSAYYYTSMRNEMEGILCAISIFFAWLTKGELILKDKPQT